MHKLNLLPMEVLNSQNRKKRDLFFVLMVSIVFLLLIYFLVFINNSKNYLENEIHDVSIDIVDMKAEMQSRGNHEQILKDFEKRQHIYEGLMQNKINYSKILNHTIMLIPREITVISLRIDTAGNLRISGYAPSNAYVARIMEDIRTIDGIIDVSLGFTRFAEAKDEIDPGYNFEIVIELAKDR